VLFLAILLLAVVLRFNNLALSPYYEWDEPVYTSIGSHVARTGVIQVKTELASDEPYYLYHPPFHFLLLGEWFKAFGARIEIARILSAILSILTLVILFFFLLGYDPDGEMAALLAMLLLSVDGWMVFSNRVAWIENAMMPIGIMGLWIYDSALRDDTPQQWRYNLAGFVLAAAALYKHVGLYFLLAVAICWWIGGRRHARAHVTMAATALALILFYVWSMYLAYGSTFLEQYQIQVRRTLGLQESRGIVESLDHLVAAVTGNYGIYAGMIATSLLSLGLFFRRIFSAVRRRSMAPLQGNRLLFSCTAAALLFFGSISLKIPHYYLMILVPLYSFAAVEVALEARRNPRHRKFIAVVVFLLCALNLNTALNLFAGPQRNAGAALRQYLLDNEPPDAVVIAEETTGTLIDQPYLKIGRFHRYLNEGILEKYDPTLLVTYESITQHPPDSPDLKRLMEISTLVETFEDFKCRLTLYRLPEGVWRDGARGLKPTSDPPTERP
jgi:4-amino-4-deoxy-L-arabinose transferase-like glycosyltransferase